MEKSRAVEVYSGPITVNGKSLLYSIVHDITQKKETEKKLQELNNELEIKIKNRTSSLENLNTALKVFVYKREKRTKIK